MELAFFEGLGLGLGKKRYHLGPDCLMTFAFSFPPLLFSLGWAQSICIFIGKGHSFLSREEQNGMFWGLGMITLSRGLIGIFFCILRTWLMATLFCRRPVFWGTPLRSRHLIMMMGLD